MIVLALETSCDDTAAAVIADGRVASNVVSSQLAHRRYGGVVPEIASRAHQRYVVPIVRNALESAAVEASSVDAVAATYGPGLAGSLLVGLSFAKAFAAARTIPFVGVNHLDGHLYSPFVDRDPVFPFLALVVSGGHTELIVVQNWTSRRRIGRTRDDAAGEAFDKVARILGLTYPGGPAIESLARHGRSDFHAFPRTTLAGYDYSYSGIKTSVLYHIRGIPEELRSAYLKDHAADIAASFQAAMVDMTLAPVEKALRDTNIRNVALSGGVSSNAAVREAAKRICAEAGARLSIAPAGLRTDNAAMIGLVAYNFVVSGQTTPLSLTVDPAAPLVADPPTGQTV